MTNLEEGKKVTKKHIIDCKVDFLSTVIRNPTCETKEWKISRESFRAIFDIPVAFLFPSCCCPLVSQGYMFVINVIGYTHVLRT